MTRSWCRAFVSLTRYALSREVYIVGETFGPSPLDESQKGSSLGGPGSAPDHDDNAVVRSLSRELEEVISIARDDDPIVMEGVIQNCGVGGCARKRLTHATHRMSKVLKKVAQLLRDVIVQEEVHDSRVDICRATRTSISPRWSS